MKKNYKILTLSIAIVFTAVLFLASFQNVSAKSDLPAAAQKRLANAIVLYIGSNDAYVNNVKTSIDKSNSEVCPVAVNGRTLVPIRFISESLGAKVSWDSKTSTATIAFKGKTIKITVGNNKMLVNNTETALEVAASESSSRIYVPFRAIVEALGKKVFYDRGLIVISDKEDIFNIKTEKSLLDGIIAKINNLPVVGSETKLKQLLASAFKQNSQRMYMMEDSATLSAAAPNSISQSLSGAATNSVAQSAEKSVTASSDYSTTNVQVQGVDEADIVKTDGKYIYQVNQKKIVVADVYAPENMKIESTVSFSDNNFMPTELYIDGNKLIVIGSTVRQINCEKSGAESETSIYRPYYQPSFVKAIVYDISDKSNIKQLRDFEIEGSYLSSRKIGSALYMVTNKYINTYYYDQNVKESVTPMYYDSVSSKKEMNIDCANIRYFPGDINPNYMVVAGINLDNIDSPANINSYLGSGDNIYVSEDNLYVALNNNKHYYTLFKANSISADSNESDESTTIYKFSLDNSKVTYLGKGEVPGRILNQFSMDEYNGNFRIATTKGQVWSQGENAAKNNVYVLSDSLSIMGKIEDIAPGEQIYSVRFMGTKAYMVTFKKTDPLFVIDLKDPKDPKILGKLKIPGFSDYIHPYDENHIIGFGKDAVEAKQGDFAWYQGMKIAMFDVSDVSNPKEMFTENIGDRGTYSELLDNHKALLFSKEKNLMAFPVTVMEIKDKEKKFTDNDYPEYGQLAFQGAYVYNVDLKNGFTLKGKITHISDDEYLKAGDSYYYGNNNIQRILYIKDALYTISQGMIKANNIKTMDEINSIKVN